MPKLRLYMYVKLLLPGRFVNFNKSLATTLAVRSAVGAVPVPSSHFIVITNWVEFATSKTCAPESTVFTTNSV